MSLSRGEDLRVVVLAQKDSQRRVTGDMQDIRGLILWGRVLAEPSAASNRRS
jgi:hypothetical protein